MTCREWMHSTWKAQTKQRSCSTIRCTISKVMCCLNIDDSNYFRLVLCNWSLRATTTKWIRMDFVQFFLHSKTFFLKQTLRFVQQYRHSTTSRREEANINKLKTTLTITQVGRMKPSLRPVPVIPSNKPLDLSTYETHLLDIPVTLNKSRNDLELLDKNELIQLIMSNNAFIFQHMLGENSMLKQEIAILTVITAAQTHVIDDLTRRFSNIENEVWRKGTDPRTHKYIRNRSIETSSLSRKTRKGIFQG